MRFLILIIFIINIIYTPNIAKADNFLGNCNLGNEGQYLNTAFQIIDEFGFNGDFIESQGFAYLAIRSYLKKFISLLISIFDMFLINSNQSQLHCVTMNGMISHIVN